MHTQMAICGASKFREVVRIQVPNLPIQNLNFAHDDYQFEI